MDFLRNFSIRTKILLIPLVGTMGFLVYMLISTHYLKGAAELLGNARTKHFPLLQIAQTNLDRIGSIQNILSYAVTSSEVDVLKNAEDVAKGFREDIRKSKDIDPDSEPQLSLILEIFEEYYLESYNLSEGMINETIEFSSISSRSQTMSESLETLENQLRTFYDSRLEHFNHAFANANKSSDRLTSLGVILCLITLALLFAAAIPISTMIKTSLDRVIETLKNIAEDNGDLTLRLETRNKDEIGELVEWFNTFMDKLQSVIHQIVDTAPPLANLATDVNELSGSITVTLSQQNNSVADSKNNIELMSRSIAYIAQNAGEAAHAAKIADEEAGKGQAVVASTVTGILKLSDSVRTASEVIAKLEQDANSVNVVLAVIKSIAEQTNLLALNAAIEAARAGEQGRGFAVVADEVRGLASRTQESTAEINSILDQLQSASQAAVQTIKQSTAAVGRSVEDADIAGQSLRTITETVKTINSMNNQIARATDEQQFISTELVSEVERILQQTHTTAQSASKLSDVSKRLNSLAVNLEQITRQFRV